MTEVLIKQPNEIISCLNELKDSGYQMLVDLCGVDYPSSPERFEVVYQLLSLTLNKRITVKVRGDKIPSVFMVFKSAIWFEREAYDMFGIVFEGSPDLRRILTDYNFAYFPLRKDFPTTGFEEIKYDLDKGEIVYTPVHLMQEYRNFDSQKPWEGTCYEIMNNNDKTKQ